MNNEGFVLMANVIFIYYFGKQIFSLEQFHKAIAKYTRDQPVD